MKTAWIMIASAWLASSQTTQAGALHIESMAFSGKAYAGQPVPVGSLALPRIKSTNSGVADNINDRLFIGEMGRMDVTTPPKDIPGKSNPRFSIVRNDDKVLSLDFQAEHCQIQCESSHTYYNFDSTTGRYLTASDLLSSEGLKDISGRLQHERQQRYKQVITALQKEQMDDKVKASGGRAIQPVAPGRTEQLAFYQHCLDSLSSTVTAPAQAESLFNHYHYRLTAKALDITTGRCTDSHGKWQDDVGEITLSLPYASIKTSLSDYGRWLLTNEGNVRPGFTPFGPLLRGYMGGKTLVTMVLNKLPDGTLSGSYFYDHRRQPVMVTGRVQGQDIQLVEKTTGTSGNTPNQIHLHVALGENKLKGTWSQGGQQWDIELQAQG